MTMKKFSFLTGALALTILASCGDYKKGGSETETSEQPKSMVADPETYDPKRGEGKWTAENVNVTPNLNQEWAASGEQISATKCLSCHKITEEKLVGPGWAGVTKRRSPEWIMNFITNPDPMLNKDPEAQAMLEICLVRMPNQNLSDAEARNILEYMRKVDGVK
jgi:mono/diheme cytochrome c family protein